MFNDYFIPSIISLVATSPSLKRLILRTAINPFYAESDITAIPYFCRPLVLLVDHCSLEHIEIRILTLNMVLSDLLMVGVPELKVLCDRGFLSVTVEFGEWLS